MPRAIRLEEKRRELVREAAQAGAPKTALTAAGGIQVSIQNDQGRLIIMCNHSRCGSAETLGQGDVCGRG